MSTQTQQQSLVERLRNGVIWTVGDRYPEDDVVDDVATDQLLREAADEIERLQREVEGLRSQIEAERELGMNEAARAQAEARDWQERYYDERLR